MGEKVEGKLNDLKASLQTEDIAAIKEAQEALQQEVVSLGQAIYSNTEGGAPGPEGADGQAPGPDPTGTESSKSDSKPDDDNVVDAEFKETDNQSVKFKRRKKTKNRDLYGRKEKKKK